MNVTQRLSLAAAAAFSLSSVAVLSADPAQTLDASRQAVLTDATAHSHLLAAGAGGSAGWDDGSKSKDGDFSLKIGTHVQFRNVIDYRQEAKNGDADSTTNGFEVRRARLELSGTAFSPDLSYYIQWDSSRNGGDTSLLDYWTQFKLSDQIAFKGGQYKSPWTHEENVSDKYQLAVEKSNMNEFLGGGTSGRVQGVSVIYGLKGKDEPLFAQVMIHDGNDSRNTDFTDDVSYWGAAGRVEYKMSGDWKNYDTFSAQGTKEDLLVIGGGMNVSQAPNITLWQLTADVQFETAGGLSIYGAVIYDNIDTRNIDDNLQQSSGYGVLVQAGYMMNEQFELFGRLDAMIFDEELPVIEEDMLPELTVGVNYFPIPSAGQKFKVTLDLTWLPNGSLPNTGAGIQGNGSNTEIVVRSQLNFAL